MRHNFQFSLDENHHTVVMDSGFYRGTIFRYNRGYVAVSDPEFSLSGGDSVPEIAVKSSAVEALMFVLPAISEVRAEQMVDFFEDFFKDSFVEVDGPTSTNFTQEEWE